jgi:hypothetical protein
MADGRVPDVATVHWFTSFRPRGRHEFAPGTVICITQRPDRDVTRDS